MKKKAYFSGGCFWCTEAIFSRIKGVIKVSPIYIGGKTSRPTYEQVCDGSTGHAEGVELVYDPTIINYRSLVLIFFSTHDPTSLNRQGNDVGTQYRSAIFFESKDEEKTIKSVVDELIGNAVFKNPIVTEILLKKNFYPAETDHINFYDNNTSHPYCQAVISPKINKLINQYQKFLK